MSKKVSDFESRITRLVSSGRRAEALEDIEKMLGRIYKNLGETTKFEERVKVKTPEQIESSLRWRVKQVKILRAQLDKISPSSLLPKEEEQVENNNNTAVSDPKDDVYDFGITWRVTVGVLACLGAIALSVIIVGKPLYSLIMLGAFFFYLLFVLVRNQVSQQVEEDDVVEEDNASASVNMHDTAALQRGHGWYDRLELEPEEPEDDD